MLTINIRNDGTGTDEAANYTYIVMVNLSVIARGKITGHNRSDGWQELVRMVVDDRPLEAGDSE